MPTESVLITRPIPEAGMARLRAAGLAVQLSPTGRQLQVEELCRIVGRHDAVICHLNDRINADVLTAAVPRCKIFASCAVGYDNIDVATAGRLGIIITNTPDVLTETTADLAWALIMAAARRLGEAERVVRAGAWHGWGMLDFLGTDVYGKTLGIVGAGRIGTAVARRAAGFSMRVLYFDQQQRKTLEALGAQRADLDTLLASSDFVSLHTPLTSDTRYLIDERAIGRMKRGAILVNTARGAVVDQAALAKALAEGRLAAAGLDVYENEPAVPAELLALENIVLLPHIGSATVETRSKMAEMAADNVIAVLEGRPPLNPVAV